MNRKFIIIVLSIVICICSSCGNQHDEIIPGDAASLITNETVTETEETSEPETVIQDGIVYYDCGLTPEIFFAETGCTETDLLPPECDPSENEILYADDIGFCWPVDYYENGSIISTDDTIYTTDGYDLSDFTGFIVMMDWYGDITVDDRYFYSNPNAYIARLKNGELNYVYRFNQPEKLAYKAEASTEDPSSTDIIGHITDTSDLSFVVGDNISTYYDERLGLDIFHSGLFELTVFESGYYIFEPSVKDSTARELGEMLYMILYDHEGKNIGCMTINNCKNPFDTQIYRFEEGEHYYFRCGYGTFESGIGPDSEITIWIKPFEF